MSQGWVQAPIWAEWVKLTRLQWSARIAFEREVALWRGNTSGQIDSPHIRDSGGTYRTSLARHIATLDDPGMFYELVLLRSYSLMESHCKYVWHICATPDWSLMNRTPSDHERDIIDAIELRGGIEAWSAHLVKRTKQRWADVYGGLEGLVEISIVRNALMHGYTHVSSTVLASATKRGCFLPYQPNDVLTLNFQQLHEYRGRMKSLCRILSDGVIHLARGTHRDKD